MPFNHRSLSLAVNLVGNSMLNYGVPCRGIALGAKSRLAGILSKSLPSQCLTFFFTFSYKALIKLPPKVKLEKNK